MAFLRQWLLILFALVLSGDLGFADPVTKEQRAYAAAVSVFQDAMWSRAETALAEFVQKYPQSPNVPQALLLQAQAEFKQGKLTNSVSLLGLNQDKAGNLADQYIYWTGEAQFQNGDFMDAAETFISLAQNFSESPLRLRAVVEAATACAQFDGWPQIISLLQETNGVFAHAAQLDAGNELVSRGRLLLAQAKFSQNDFGGAAAVLDLLKSQPLAPGLDWQRVRWIYRLKLAANNLGAALAATTNLIQIARLEKNDALTSESVTMQSGVLEKMNRLNDAIATYQENLAPNMPAERQREAILKIAELSLAQNQFANAEQSLENFLAQFPDSPAADVALLTSGELYLKNFVAQPADTNLLQQAYARFDHFIGAFTNSPLLGDAFLDRGWCFWLEGKIPESLKDFRSAEQKLPFSPELAVAKFKIGDALFRQNDFAGARESYRAVSGFADFPIVAQTLADRALYQAMRASLELKDRPGASAALAQLLKRYPPSALVHDAEVLYGEGLTDLGKPTAARVTFETFEQQFPDSPLLPQVELAIAHTYELQQDWPNVIAKYADWLNEFPTNELRFQIAYSLALANFHAGNETNAFNLFTNFVAQFPTNELAPQAQWWVAEHFFRAGDFVNAEKNYKYVFQGTNWQNSPLFYPAQMMAGRAAVGWGGYADAIGFFTGLASDTNCPPELDAQARFGWGSALTLSDSTDTNNALANFQSATNIFDQICRMYPTNELAALAGIEIGKCDLQLMNYDAATNAYAQVFNSPLANISARSQAQIGFGITLEKKAALATASDQTNLLQLALDNYLQVFGTWTGNGLRNGESADSFWVKKAGLQAADLVSALGEWQQAAKIYSQLEGLLPQLKDSLEKKIAAANEHLPPEKNE